MVNGAITQDAMCEYGWVKEEWVQALWRAWSTGCTTVEGGKNQRSQIAEEARVMEQLERDSKCWLWETGIGVSSQKLARLKESQSHFLLEVQGP